MHFKSVHSVLASSANAATAVSNFPGVIRCPRRKQGRTVTSCFFRDSGIHKAPSFIAMVFLLYALSVSGSAATLPSGFVETTVASGIASPTAMAIAPDGRIFVCSQTGALRVIKNGVLLATPFVILSVDSIGVRGLLVVAFDTHFTWNHFIYVYDGVSGHPSHN